MQSNYQNPTEALEQRDFYQKGSDGYKYLQRKVMDELSLSNMSYYCGSHHSFETRHSLDFHKQCKIYKRGEIFTSKNILLRLCYVYII